MPEVGRSDGRAVRMLDVAAAAGVSRATVSNVLRGSPTVAEPVRASVVREADRLGYVYDRGAAGLRRRRSQLIGLVVPHIANPFIAEAVRGAHEVLARHGYLMATVETDDDLDRQAVALRSMSEHRVDGFLVLPALGSGDERLLQVLGGRPVVLVNRDVGLEGVAYVGPDEETVARLGAEHLLVDHACDRVAYFGGPAAAGPRRSRSELFARMASDARARVDEPWSAPCSATATDGYRAAAELLGHTPPPAGLFCHSDTIAYGVLRALADHGVPPSRCRVVGCDDLPDSPFRNPGLTSVSVDAMAIGRAAAGRLLGQLDVAAGVPPVPTPHLVVRESCGCVPGQASPGSP